MSTPHPESHRERYLTMVHAAEAVALLHRETAPDDDEMRALDAVWESGWPTLEEFAAALQKAALSFAEKHGVDPAVWP